MTHHHDGIRVTISPRGMGLYRSEIPRFVDEQRPDNVIGVHTAITIGSALGLIAAFGSLVLAHIWGA